MNPSFLSYQDTRLRGYSRFGLEMTNCCFLVMSTSTRESAHQRSKSKCLFLHKFKWFYSIMFYVKVSLYVTEEEKPCRDTTHPNKHIIHLEFVKDISGHQEFLHWPIYYMEEDYSVCSYANEMARVAWAKHFSRFSSKLHHSRPTPVFIKGKSSYVKQQWNLPRQTHVQ